MSSEIQAVVWRFLAVMDLTVQTLKTITYKYNKKYHDVVV